MSVIKKIKKVMKLNEVKTLEMVKEMVRKLSSQRNSLEAIGINIINTMNKYQVKIIIALVIG
jgi:hypothetical protein